ncbi:hypothetical protein OGAPHI_007434 [Ogataea philodendri]|uniref:Septation initiation network scaffold protein cdc11 n=1 Tax=Ogataea philodendri TaxID=1378263 RepID=A0A9P8SZL7_9ASCO|nr:uncharacterized protein OGAPHI_007434 [Ogataea philodendri]KAH3660229.1 hypothetical protein OGAPHI_007434 [Ogataea philodendri]
MDLNTEDSEYTQESDLVGQNASVNADNYLARSDGSDSGNGKKYILNSDFNQPSPEHKQAPKSSWMPEVLQEEHWPDTIDESRDPYLSIGETNTLIRREGGDEAAWRKYRDGQFKQKLQEPPVFTVDSEPPAVDTFGRSTDHSILPASPLKLFGKQDTYTTERFRDMLKKIDGEGADDHTEVTAELEKSASHASLQLLLRNSEELFNKLKNRTQPANNEEESDYTETDDAQSSRSTESAVFDSPTPSRPDVTASLEILKQKLDLSVSDEVDKSMSIPRIRGKEDKHIVPVSSESANRPGIKFISGENYKGKVYDKRLQKFVPADEYTADGDEDASLDELNEISDFDEMSFFQAKSHLVAAITEQYPSQDWLEVEKLDVSDRKLDKLRDMDKFVPHLRVLEANDNELTHIDGVPKSLQILKANNNLFTSMSMFNLNNLQVLELRNCHLTNLRGLKLYNLNSLDVSYNEIDTLQGLENFKMLQSLTIAGNNLRGTVNFSSVELLEKLDVDENAIVQLTGLDELARLTELSANRNQLTSFHCTNSSLRKLSLNFNNISEIDLQGMPELRVFKIDRNPVIELKNVPTKVVQISAKYHSHAIDGILVSGLYKLQKLSLSGSVFPSKGAMTNVTVLNLSAMGLETLPDLGKWFPMLTDLDLNFNKLHSVKGISTLHYLRELKLLSNSIDDLGTLIPYTREIRKTLKLLDLRVNPVNRGLYPYVFYDDEPEDEPAAEMTLNLKECEDIEAFSVEYTKLYEKEAMESWTEKNEGFLRKVARPQAVARQRYESTLIAWFENINYLDGLWISYERRLDERKRIREIRGL